MLSADRLYRTGLAMLDYAIRRVLLLILTLVVGSIVLFVSLKTLPPRDAVEVKLGPEILRDDPQLADDYRRMLGIYGPLHEQYLRWATGFLTGDWGKSMMTERPIFDELKARIPVSMELSFVGLFVAWLISFPVGIWAAIRQDSIPDYLVRLVAYTLDALPSFVLAILLLTFLAVNFQWAPPVSFTRIWADPMSHLQIMALPALLTGATSIGGLMRYSRAFFLEVLRHDYIRTARSKGLPERMVIMRHALRNVMLPFLTILGAQIPLLLTSSAIIETLFSLPGMGRYLITAATTLDYPVVMTTTMFFGIIALSTQLIVDLAYAWVDPRVSYARRG